MGIERYHEKIKRDELRDRSAGEMAWGIPGAGEGLESLVRGVGDWWRGRNKEPQRIGIDLYNPPAEPRFKRIIPDPLELISPKAHSWMERNMMDPAVKWATKTVPRSFQEWNESYVRPTGPISGDVSRDWRGQMGDVGKWFVNTPYTIGTAIADVGADVLQFSEAIGPKWMGEGGRDIFSKEQKYRWDAAAVDKLGIKSFYKDNPYVKYDWSDNWTEKTNPILDKVWDSTAKHMYGDFLTEDMSGGIWDEIINETGYDNLMGKTDEKQNEMFFNKFYEKYANEWKMNLDYEEDRILKRDYGLGGKSTPGAIEEFEIGLNYDPLLPYSTSEDAFLRGATKGVGEALLWVGGPGMLTKSRKFIPKWKKKHLDEGIMGAARGTKYGDPEPWVAPEYLRIGGG